jgi:hypothetical protein
MADQSDRHRLLTIRARAAMFRRAATYISLRAEKEQIETHAAALEREADALERALNDTAIARAEAVSAPAKGLEAVAAMKEETETRAPEQIAETPNPAMFKRRAERLREIAARLPAEDKEFLLAISADYDELAQTLAAPKSEPA